MRLSESQVLGRRLDDLMRNWDFTEREFYDRKDRVEAEFDRLEDDYRKARIAEGLDED